MLIFRLTVKYSARKILLVFNMGKKEGEACDTTPCQTCGASVVKDVCSGCNRPPKECVCDKDVTSSVYPM